LIHVWILSEKAAEDDAVVTAITKVDKILFQRSAGERPLLIHVIIMCSTTIIRLPNAAITRYLPPVASLEKSLEATIVNMLPNTKAGTRVLITFMMPLTINH
jgi:hypothetical protein